METLVLDCRSDALRSKSIRRAAELLAAGRIVAFPTETVYGLGVTAGNPDAEARLREARGREPDKPFTVAIADAETVSRFVGTVPPVGRRLMRRCWPGPLTIVFENRGGGTVGLRLPAHEVARDLIRKAGGALLAPSANAPGEAPATDAQGVLSAFAGKIDAVLDGGPVEHGHASTVVRVGADGYEVLREGVLGPTALQRAANVVVLFVCSGNSCRSPIAEALCRQLLAQRLDVPARELERHGYTVTSGGTAGGFAEPASRSAIAAMHELGIDLSNHLSQTVTPAMVANADRVFVMTREQLGRVRAMASGNAGHVDLLDPDGGDVDDPHGRDLETYRRCAAVIRRALEKRIPEL
jgi:protein-tyrosine phosphatase